MKITYYLWKDSNNIFYITDYKEVSKDGKVQIDGYGFLEVELVLSSKVKSDLWEYTQKLTINNK